MLTVYKASAGSGKTFTLAVEYISLLIRNPMDYEHILAVTFTNKATEEMKMRIISQLYGIAKGLPDSRLYLEKVMEKSGKDRTTVERHAAIALSNLIHHYNYFRVQTIDAFFQTVFRNLARELDLTPNLRIDLDDKQIEERAVEELINSLDQNTDVLRWIRDYIDQNIRDDKSWNIIDKVKAFGQNIFKDFYKQHAAELNKKMTSEKFFSTYTKTLRQRKECTQSALQQEARTLVNLLRESGYDDATHFKQGVRGIYGYIQKLDNATEFDNQPLGSYAQSFMDDPVGWTKSKEAVPFVVEQLHPALVAFETKRLQAWYDTESASLTLSHINQLRLLHAIASTVDDLCREGNRFQLSNTQTLLHELMGDSDSPFVYEKIGAQLHHIMIDEFQDTGRVQWTNFKKLLDNCMATTGSHNLIVGDVKQSIYRWRSGDWRLLNDIATAFPKEQLREQPLTANHRSEELVVAFNNAFFQAAVDVTMRELSNDSIDHAEQLARAYRKEELVQVPFRTGQRGYVDVALLPSTSTPDDAMEQLCATISSLIERGVAANDIAILVRRNQEGEQVAGYLMKMFPELAIVSNEAFRMDASQAINIIIDALRLLVNPMDVVVRAQLVKGYQRFVIHSDLTDVDLLVCEHPEEFLPEAYLQRREELLTTPFIDLVDELYRMFSVATIPNQSAYVCAFYDQIQQFMHDNTSSLDAFLKEWDDHLASKTIQSDEANGIRIITLHKSKGLEFDHVIMPFCNWEMERNDTIIWCSGEHPSPYDELPLVPMTFSKTHMTGTAYEKDYKEEHLQNVVDNMNLLYVAFTRASKSLHVISRRLSDKQTRQGLKTQSRRGEVLQWALPQVTELLTSYSPIYTEAASAEDVTRFQMGSLNTVVPQSGQQRNTDSPPSRNVFLQPVVPHPIRLESFSSMASFRQSNRSKEFVSGEDEQPTRRLTYIKLGNILHALFSHIETLDDIAPRLKELELEGIIYDDELSPEELTKKIRRSVEDPVVSNWFSPHWKLYNECTILENDPATGTLTEHRPDRVMTDDNETIVVDFKFGQQREEYSHQVKRYMHLLTAMGHQHVSGYLWYVLKGEVVNIHI